MPVTLVLGRQSLTRGCGPAAGWRGGGRGAWELVLRFSYTDRDLLDERSCVNRCSRRHHLQVTAAPICISEKLASVTMLFPLVRFPLVETIRLANGVSQSLDPARTS